MLKLRFDPAWIWPIHYLWQELIWRCCSFIKMMENSFQGDHNLRKVMCGELFKEIISKIHVIRTRLNFPWTEIENRHRFQSCHTTWITIQDQRRESCQGTENSKTVSYQINRLKKAQLFSFIIFSHEHANDFRDRKIMHWIRTESLTLRICSKNTWHITPPTSRSSFRPNPFKILASPAYPFDCIRSKFSSAMFPFDCIHANIFFIPASVHPICFERLGYPFLIRVRAVRSLAVRSFLRNAFAWGVTYIYRFVLTIIFSEDKLTW